MRRTTKKKDRLNVLFCPAQEWHRHADVNHNQAFDPQFVIGYFCLPHRNPSFWMNSGWGYNYNFAGLRGWVEKKKFGRQFAKAPLAMDMKQAIGPPPAPGTVGRVQWFHSSPRKAYSSHVKSTGEPFGGDFLFEDGGVRWYESREVDAALTGQGWVLFYKVAVY